MTAFRDARNLPGGTSLVSSVCIVGAGAAGITLARELAKAKIDCLLIEAGNNEISGETQALYIGENTGVKYYDLASCRLRYFGGTTNHWSGFCRANDPIDFEARSEINLPGWPIDHQDLAPFMAQAAELLGINSDFFDPAAQLRDKGLEMSELIDRQSEMLTPKNFQIAKNIRFGPRFRDEIAQSEYIKPVENLNVTRIVLDESRQRVESLEAATLDGKAFTITANTFVLCCHAIENARLLLDSDQQQPGGGRQQIRSCRQVLHGAPALVCVKNDLVGSVSEIL